MKDTFFLDVDDTLLDFRRAEREQLLATLQAHGIAADGRTADLFHTINDGLWKALERGETTRERLVVDRFSILLGRLGQRGDAAALSDTFFAGTPSRAYAIAGAADFLAALRRRGRVYAVTNGAKELQRRRIGAAGLEAFFDGMFISGELGCNKPSDGYVARVLEGVPAFCAARSVYAGDSLTSDLVCAQKMGVDFILLRPACPAGYGGLYARDYAEALALIGAL